MSDDPVNALLDHLTEDARSFSAIARSWAKAAQDLPEVMMKELVSAFWRGEFEHDGKSSVFVLLKPDSPHIPDSPVDRTPGNYVFTDEWISKVGADLQSYVTAERKRVQIFRREAARFFFWKEWDCTDDGLLGLATFPFEKCPEDMHEWCMRRDDFAKWSLSTALIAEGQLGQFWPDMEARQKGRSLAKVETAPLNALCPSGKPSNRDVLITKVQHGELTPQGAAEEAARLGLEPFEFSPSPSEFDPTRELTWSLPMALAWIMWRTADAVREMWDPYREKSRYWFFQRWQVPGGPIYEGYFLKTRDPAGLIDVAVLAASSTTPKRSGIDSYRDAFRVLSNAAQHAMWRASGVPTDGKPRREIPPLEWIDLDVCEADGKAGIRRAVLRDRQRGALDIGYDNVLFPVPGFRKTFSAGASKERKRGRPPVIQWDVLKAEFLRLMDHHGDVSNDDLSWNSYERVIAALMEFYSEKRNSEVSRAALQPKVTEWLEEWRERVARK